MHHYKQILSNNQNETQPIKVMFLQTTQRGWASILSETLLFKINKEFTCLRNDETELWIWQLSLPME